MGYRDALPRQSSEGYESAESDLLSESSDGEEESYENPFMERRPVVEKEESDLGLSNSERKVLLWHKRLGHCGLRTLYDMSRQGNVEGIELDLSRRKVTQCQCRSCQVANIKQKAHTGKWERSHTPGAIIHSDVSSRIRPK